MPSVAGVRDVEGDDRAQGVSADEMDEPRAHERERGEESRVIPRLVVHQLEADGARVRMGAREAADVAATLWDEPADVENTDGPTMTSKRGTRVAPCRATVVSVTRNSSSYATTAG